MFASLLGLVIGGDNLVTRVFSWRPLVAVGVMSYSLYLVHQPMVQLVVAIADRRAATSLETFWILILVLPLIFALSWLLFMGVERFTLTSRSPAAVDPRVAMATEHQSRDSLAPARG
jgi:peptidoglycan/LPS O-acetylase OafA/YrhL